MRTCAYRGKKCSFFSENLACFLFLKHPFWDSTFCLITDEFQNVQINKYCSILINWEREMHFDTSSDRLNFPKFFVILWVYQ